MADEGAGRSNGPAPGVAEYGDPGGVPLVFCHGWPSSRLQGRLLDGPARRRGVRVLAPDRPGIGLSETRPLPDAAGWADTAARLADDHGIGRFLVLGVSGGAPYALACAWALPERVRAVGVCCGAPPMGLLPASMPFFWPYRLLLALDRAAPRLSLPVMTAIGLGVRALPPAGCLKPMVPLLARADRKALSRPEAFTAVSLSVHEAFRRGAAGLVEDARRIRGPWGFPLGAVAPPALFWHGCRDRNVPLAAARWLSRRVPGAVERLFDEDGHYSLPVERAGEILDDLAGAAAR